MPRPSLLELASEGEGVGVPAAADLPDSERALALAHLGGGHVAGAIVSDEEAAPEPPGVKAAAGEGRT